VPHTSTIITSSLFAAIAMIGIGKIGSTHSDQWVNRPSLECDNGRHVHQYVEVNASRVNIRDLPTVFSNVLTQKNTPDKLTVLCEFGVWSRVDLPNIAPETWISTGLINLLPEQPLTGRTKFLYLWLSSVGLVGLLMTWLRPQWITKAIDLLLQTQDLPAYAKPLISITPKYHPVRDGNR